MRDDMSPQEREVVGKWLNSLWDEYTALVEKGRNKSPGEVTAFVNDFPERLEAYGGDLAEVFLQEGYVHELLYGDELEERGTEIVDARDDDGDIQLVGLQRYVSDIRDRLRVKSNRSLPLFLSRAHWCRATVFKGRQVAIRW